MSICFYDAFFHVVCKMSKWNFWNSWILNKRRGPAHLIWQYITSVVFWMRWGSIFHVASPGLSHDSRNLPSQPCETVDWETCSFIILYNIEIGKFFSMINEGLWWVYKIWKKNIFFSDIIFSKNGNANYLGRCQAYPSFKLEESFKVLILARFWQTVESGM